MVDWNRIKEDLVVAIGGAGLFAVGTWAVGSFSNGGIIRFLGGGPGIPAGAVVAFSEACPPGWDVYQPAVARFVVGAGVPSDAIYQKWRQQKFEGSSDIPLTAHALLSSGGSESLYLLRDQIPQIDSPLYNYSENKFYYLYKAALNADIGSKIFVAGMKTESDAKTGNDVTISAPTGGREVNTVPPYIALSYCKMK